MKKILFITWDGPQVNYLETLFLPIFLRLKEKGFEFHIAHFTWGNNTKPAEICRDQIPYQKYTIIRKFGPIGSFLTLVFALFKIRKQLKRAGITYIMPRSVFPLLLALWLKKFFNHRILFDFDGLALDERIDFAGWNPTSLVYRYLRDVEYRGIRAAEIILTRTKKTIAIIKARGGLYSDEKIKLVYNGRDLKQFNLNPNEKDIRKELQIDADAKVFIYVGSFGEQYCFDEMLKTYQRYKGKSNFLILSSQAAEINHWKSQHGLGANVIVISVDPQHVASYIKIADIGLSYRQPSFSMQGVSPIKIGEYLLCGIPVLATKHVGDTAALFEDNNCGYCIDDFTEESYLKAINWFSSHTLSKEDLNQIGTQYFGLENTITTYENALKNLK